ncbi:MAG: bifunctional alpha,alpha-trehalose-phosphate synthase (UDP-forming)/trehalose-phosphatase [Deltaproteobacteria bacterium]|nr:bifunctional alpha,alpha-trehalose-phosphate synthase (UDP-forming)/trehalose-phosphatase [Deltaproteobacteria bacterium]
MRLILVSNRLPFTVTERDGELKFNRSVGGVATGLSTYLELQNKSALQWSEVLWVGWPGILATGSKKTRLEKIALKEHSCLPVFFSKKALDKYYYGFCNRTLWPLFHYFTSYAVYDESYWEEYVRVNEIFCEALLKILKPNDCVWVHDLQLMLLPQMLRKKKPDLRIGYFHHIPFPGYEIFRMLPKEWGRSILEGLLGADLIGFHTHDYAQYFLRSLLRILGISHEMGVITHGERLIECDAYPMGIDYQKFHQAVQTGASGEKKIIFSVDRLDYTKGIEQRLQGFATFLERYPQWKEKVTFILVVSPSREGVERYQQMKKNVDELVGRINGRFGNIRWTPIQYQYRSLSFAPLVALYQTADIAVITPLRDGMNLIAKEYVASRVNGDGVLILSDMIGAAKELSEAILINPNNQWEIADALHQALQLSKKEQKRRMQKMQGRLQRYDVVHWADHFLTDLLRIKEEQKKFESKLLDPKLQKKLIARFRSAKKQILLVDYDGTLVDFADDPASVRPSPAVLQLLRKLAKKAELVLISGRSRKTIQEWFGGIGIHLVAEHGVWVCDAGKEWTQLKKLNNDWKPKIAPLLELFTDRLPGSFIEEKEFSYVWHYRTADPEQGAVRSKELIEDLNSLSARHNIDVLQGNRIVEVRSAGVDKGTSGLHFINRKKYDFILSIGDDWTDEDLFRVLPANAYSIRVGMVPSHARFHLHEPKEVLAFLQNLSRK